MKIREILNEDEWDQRLHAAGDTQRMMHQDYEVDQFDKKLEREAESATKPSATKPGATKPSATKPSATKPSATKPGGTMKRLSGDYVNINGWHTKNDTTSSKHNAGKFQDSLRAAANTWDVDSPRAFTSNVNPTVNGGSMDTDTRAEYRIRWPDKQFRHNNEVPVSGGITLPTGYTQSDFDHELAHHMSNMLTNVDAVGNMKAAGGADEWGYKDSSRKTITTFSHNYGPDGKNDYIDMLDSHSTAGPHVPPNKHHLDDPGFFDSWKTGNSNIDYQGLKKSVYTRFMDNPNNTQRPELKTALADTVSAILSDKYTINDSQSWYRDKSYGLDPEEMFARTIAQFGEMKRLPADKRFDHLSGFERMTPETYNSIQRLMDTIRVKNGHTMAKMKTRSRKQNPTRLA
jgi:hypothetical protein